MVGRAIRPDARQPRYYSRITARPTSGCTIALRAHIVHSDSAVYIPVALECVALMTAMQRDDSHV